MFSKCFKKYLKTNLHQFRFFTKNESITLQESFLNEPCIEVNSNDEPIRMIIKEDCHKKRKHY